MKSFKIALMQLLPEDNLYDNMKKGIKYCKIAKQTGADLALFPEMWSIGYDFSGSIGHFNSKAISPDSNFILAFSHLAAELHMAIAITFLEKHFPKPRNTLFVFDRFGKNILSYSKVHLCDFGNEHMLSHGDDFYTADLNTVNGIVKIGAMICYDREFPESARILMLKGAEIILFPNACPMEINRLSQLRTRAYENMVGIATVNYPNGYLGCNGSSSAFDGIAYSPIDGSSRDTLIIQADGKEGIFIADFPMELIREYRNTEVHGNAYRHPEKYHLLISQDVNPPLYQRGLQKIKYKTLSHSYF